MDKPIFDCSAGRPATATGGVTDGRDVAVAAAVVSYARLSLSYYCCCALNGCVPRIDAAKVLARYTLHPKVKLWRGKLRVSKM